MTTKKQIIAGTLAALLGAGAIGYGIKNAPTPEELEARVAKYQEEQRPISQLELVSYMKMYHGGVNEVIGDSGDKARDITGDGIPDVHYVCKDGAVIVAKEEKHPYGIAGIYWYDICKQ